MPVPRTCSQRRPSRASMASVARSSAIARPMPRHMWGPLPQGVYPAGSFLTAIHLPSRNVMIITSDAGKRAISHGSEAVLLRYILVAW